MCASGQVGGGPQGVVGLAGATGQDRTQPTPHQARILEQTVCVAVAWQANLHT